ncbi:MAG: hypothetical protein K0R66_646 [Gammaproteobacteria bacterium]|jgi:hypothetical protein|nr:hypothetical protein [Gammaproteobacteria bacterium]
MIGLSKFQPRLVLIPMLSKQVRSARVSTKNWPDSSDIYQQKFDTEHAIRILTRPDSPGFVAESKSLRDRYVEDVLPRVTERVAISSEFDSEKKKLANALKKVLERVEPESLFQNVINYDDINRQRLAAAQALIILKHGKPSCVANDKDMRDVFIEEVVPSITDAIAKVCNSSPERERLAIVLKASLIKVDPDNAKKKYSLGTSLLIGIGTFVFFEYIADKLKKSDSEAKASKQEREMV